MIVFRYDKTFEGLLTALFDAYQRKTFPEKLISIDEIEPLFTHEVYTVLTQNASAGRVWNGAKKKLSHNGCNLVMHVWLSELEGADNLIFRFMRKTFDSKHSIETNYADEDVLMMNQIAKKVDREREHLTQFVRFQKTADGMFFAPIEPIFNALPLAVEHFTDRFADQDWIVYDIKRNYGYYYDRKKAVEITLDNTTFADGKLSEELLDETEKQFQQLWKSYFNSMTIKERINPKLQRQHMPARFWKYLTEKQ